MLALPRGAAPVAANVLFSRDMPSGRVVERMDGFGAVQGVGFLADARGADGTSLAWVAGKGSDEGYQAVARLRLSGLLFETKAYDEALQQLAAPLPKDFVPLAADRRGDVLLAQGTKAEATTQYEAAYKGLDERSDYRRIIEVKLNALGVDPVVKAAVPVANEAAK